MDSSGFESPALRLARVLAKLRALKPDSLVAVDETGDEHEIAITGNRSRYERAARGVVSVGGVSCRLIKDGKVLEVLEVRKPEELAPATSSSSSAELAANVRRVDDVRELVKIALDAADRMRSRDLEVLAKVTDAAVGIMNTAAARAERLEATLAEHTARKERELARLARQVEELGAGADDNAGSKADELLEKLLGLATPSEKATPTQ